MKVLIALALFSMTAQAQVSPEALKLASLQREAAALRHRIASCEVPHDPTLVGFSLLAKKKGKKAKSLVNTIKKDLEALAQDCHPTDLSRLNEMQAEVSSLAQQLGIVGMLPSGQLTTFRSQTDEKSLEEAATITVKGMDRPDCPLDMKIEDSLSWHGFFLEHGYLCTAQLYKHQSQKLNEAKSLSISQQHFDDLEQLSLKELKALFKSEFAQEIKEDRLKIAFIPQLSYENGMLAALFPYRLFIDQTEKTSYRFLKKEFGHLGADVTVIYRNSLNPLSEQIRETEAGLAKLKAPHLLISRSMGSRVMHEIKKRAETGLGVGLKNIASWYNMGGTPNGSVIAEYKSRPDVFYRGLFPAVAQSLKLPLGLIAKDPRVVDHLPAVIYSALDRQNLKTMAHFPEINPPGKADSNLRVYNLIYLPSHYERAVMPGPDPVYTHMLSYGPTEGSAPIVGAAVDTLQSARVFYNLDHLAYWKFSPQEGLALYLRGLIAGKRSGFGF